jgi:hypothetical protein
MNWLTVVRGIGTRHPVTFLAAPLGLAISLSACDGAGPTPTAPTQTNPTPAAGLAPIEGVEVYCDSCGSPDGHTFVFTDADGFYSLEWATNGVHPLFVTKEGYEYPADTVLDAYGRIRAMVDGDTRFDVRLVRR